MLATPFVPFDLLACNRNKIEMSKNARQTQGARKILLMGRFFWKNSMAVMVEVELNS